MHWLARHLNRFGAVGAVLASLCCLGLPALVALLSAVGLGFLIDDAILLPALIVFLVVYLAGLFVGWRGHRRAAVLATGGFAAVATFAFIFIVFVRPLAYAAVVALVGVSIWDIVERRRAARADQGSPSTEHAP